MEPEHRDVVGRNNMTFVGWVGWFRRLLAAPLQLIQNSITNVLLFLYTLLVNPQLPITDPQADVRSFLERLNARYEQSAIIPFISDSYEGALKRVRRELRFLVVYLHQSAAPTTDSFLNEFLITDSFRDFLEQSDSLLWGAASNTGEGQRVARQLKVLRFPFIALIAPLPEPNGRGTTLQCVFRLSGGGETADEIFATLYAIMDDVRPHMQQLIEARIQQDRDREIVKEQEMEYAKSLQADREKQVERERKETMRRDEEKRLEAEEQNILRRRSLLERKRREVVLPEEPASTAKERIQLRIRFPGNKNQQRSFHPDDRLEDLFNFVFIDENCPDDFTILHTSPCRPLSCMPGWYLAEFPDSQQHTPNDPNTASEQTFRDAGLGEPGGYVLIVRDNDA